MKLQILTIIQILSATVDEEKLIWKNKQCSSKWMISSTIQVNIPKMCLKPTPWRCFSRYLFCILVAHHLWWRRFLALLPGVHKDRLATWPRGWPLSWLLGKLVFPPSEPGVCWKIEHICHYEAFFWGMNFHQKCFFAQHTQPNVKWSGILATIVKSWSGMISTLLAKPGVLFPKLLLALLFSTHKSAARCHRKWM